MLLMLLLLLTLGTHSIGGFRRKEIGGSFGGQFNGLHVSLNLTQCAPPTPASQPTEHKKKRASAA